MTCRRNGHIPQTRRKIRKIFAAFDPGCSFTDLPDLPRLRAPKRKPLFAVALLRVPCAMKVKLQTLGKVISNLADTYKFDPLI